jgi:anaerobic selenocysteine-containing dehydrogenase
MLSRRSFLRTTAATGVATVAGVGSLLGAKYDVVIRGGRVIDPARRASVFAGKLVRRSS